MWWCWSRRWLRLGMSLQKLMCVFEWGVTVRLHCGYFVRMTINCRHQRRRLVWHRIRLKYEIPRDLWIGTRDYWLGRASVIRLVPGLGNEGQKSQSLQILLTDLSGNIKRKTSKINLTTRSIDLLDSKRGAVPFGEFGSQPINLMPHRRSLKLCKWSRIDSTKATSINWRPIKAVGSRQQLSKANKLKLLRQWLDACFIVN